MECKDFVSTFNADMTALRGIKNWNVKQQNFDFKTPSEKSRMSIDLAFAFDISGAMTATGLNCSYLVQILQKYIVPNTTLEFA